MIALAEFNGHGWTTTNLELLARFLTDIQDTQTRHSSSLSKSDISSTADLSPPLTFHSQGGAVTFGKISGKVENLRGSVDKCITALRGPGTKKIDMFVPELAFPKQLCKSAHHIFHRDLWVYPFDHIGLSECRAETLRGGHAIYLISVVEIEIGPMSYREETKKVLVASTELNIAVAAYSPLAHGLTADSIKSADDMPAGSRLHDLTRLKEENWKHNARLVDALTVEAASKNCTPAQAQSSIAWVGALGEKVIPLPGSTYVSYDDPSSPFRSGVGGESARLRISLDELSQEDLNETSQILDTNPVKGDRYFGAQVDLKLWD